MNKEILYNFWKKYSNPENRSIALTAIVLLLFEIFIHQTRKNFIAPGAIFLIPVVFAASVGGFKPGLISAAMAITYYWYFYSIDSPFHLNRDGIFRSISFTWTCLFVTVMTGYLKKRQTELVRQQTVSEQERFSNYRYFSLVDRSVLSTQIFSPEGKTLRVNKAWENLWGIDWESFSKSGYNILEDKQLEAKGLMEYIKKGFAGIPTDIPAAFYDPAGVGLKGVARWVRAFIYPVMDENGKILEVVLVHEDITHRLETEKDLAQYKTQLETVLENIKDGVTLQDPTGKLLYANEVAAKLSGFASVSEFMEKAVTEAVSRFELLTEDGKSFPLSELPNRKALQGQYPPETVIQFKSKNDTHSRWSMVKATPIFDENNKVHMVVNIFRDVTAERSAEVHRKRSEERQKYLSQAGKILLSSLDYKQTLRSITELAVPTLADWAAIDMLNDKGEIERLSVVHQDPAKVQWAYELAVKYPTDMAAPTGLPKVLREGVSEFYPVISDEMIVAAAKNEEHLRIIRDIGFTSVMIVPLKVLSKVVGAITFVSAESGVDYDNEDLALAEELARRASIAIQNAQLYEATQHLARSEHDQAALLDTLLHNAPIGFSFVDLNLCYVRVNRVMAEINGVPQQAHIGKSIYEVLPDRLAAELEPLYRQVLQTQAPILDLEVSGETNAEPGKIRHWFVSYYPVFNREKVIIGVGTIVNEVTIQREAEKEIYFRAYHDPLTHLPNRKSFEERLLKVLHRAKNGKYKFAVMFLDMDRLKDINDTLGHDIGDEVIKEIANRIRSILRVEDLVARWGGDEFVVLLPEIFGASDAIKVSEKILAAIQPLIRVRTHTLHVTASIGIAIFPNDGEDTQTLQKNADAALYRAKESGKNRYELYTQSMNIKAVEKLGLENDLRQALARKEFILHYQPILDVKSGKIASVEVLLRWNHPRLGLLHPNKFLGISEEIGLIEPLGKWVVKTAAKNIKDLQKQNIYLNAAINLSARQFSGESLVGDLLKEIELSELDPSCLEVEITESLAMENLDKTKMTLLAFKERGISITVDDFGTGYSSLNYLKRLPIDKLKIDKSFVRHVITDEQDTSIIKAIISMAQSLHLKVVAEGVDTEMQMNLLASLGCDAIQGYFISRPLAKKELVEFIHLRNTPKVEVPPEAVKD